MAPSGTDAPAPTGPINPDDHWGQHLGIEMLEVTPERVLARIVIDERHHQPYGIAHGGVYCSIVEGVASYGAGINALSRGLKGVVGVSNSTDFLRSHAGGELRCEGRPLHSGRVQQLWEVDITRVSDGKRVARGRVRFQTLEQTPAERRAAAQEG